MSSGGTVPHQGTTSEALSPEKQQQAEQERKRGPKGQLGEGTPGSRVKAMWRSFNAQQGAPKNMLSLKAFAREALGRHQGPGWPDDMTVLQADVVTWTVSKGAGTPEQRKERAKRLKERKSLNWSAKLARRSKGKQKKKDSSETSRSVDR